MASLTLAKHVRSKLWGWGRVREFGTDMHTLRYLKTHNKGPVVEHRELCSMLCGSLGGRGAWGRMDTRVCMAESLCCPSETITALLIGHVKVKELCPILCNPMGYTVHGILQARILKWIAFPFSRGSSHPEIEPRPPSLQADSLPAEPQGKPLTSYSPI